MCTHSSLLKFMKETDLIREVAELYCKSLRYYLIALIVVSFLCFCRTYMTDEKGQSSHSTEENVVTFKDLSSLFVDS